VPGDRPEVIASGPLSPDPTSFRDAEVLLRRRGLWNALPAAVHRHLREGREGRHAETPQGDDPAFREVHLRVVAGGPRAVSSAAAEARRLGYAVQVLTHELRGEARAAGRGLARVGRAVRDGVGPVRPPACVLAAGETVVSVTGPGRGGRNQEVALGAALALEGAAGILVASLGTDGVDGPTDAAGGWVDGGTVGRGRALGLDAGAALDANDAYPYLEAVDGLLKTGPTGTNVADVMVVLVGD
jgi:glycerate 2-kinase